ncbi:MAG TPA: aminotransferase class I/II-fold pyridoxal phosphate-dependent enzyme [Bacillota bacterium]|jgi:aspartate/methionine/tyrosine aminotransferase
MRLAPFALERWFDQYEFRVEHHISASCAAATNTAELLALAGPEARQTYLGLSLDYIETGGTAAYREAVASWYDRIGPDDVQATLGAAEAIFILMNTITGPGDRLIVENPNYQSLAEVARAAGAEVLDWPLRPENQWRPDLDELAGLLDKGGVKAVVINHPHNPTGAILTRDEQAGILAMAEAAGARLISDEVYRGLIYDPTDVLPPAADLSERAVSIGDLTKPFGLGGLRAGWIATRDHAVLEACAEMHDYMALCGAAPSEFLAAIALKHRETLLARKMSVARTNREAFRAVVARHPDKLSWVPPKGGVTAFPAYSARVDSRTFCRGLVERANTLLLPGAVYGVEGRFRIGFGGAPKAFSEGLKRLEEYAEDLD